MKKLIISILITLFIPFITQAEDINIDIDNTQNEENIDFLEEIEYKENIAIGENWIMDLTELSNDLKERYSSKISFEWNTSGDTTKIGDSYEKSFENFGEKKINLSIYKINGYQRELITSKDINLFVYKNSIAVLFEDELADKIDNFILKAKEEGILIYKVATLKSSEIENTNIIESINTYKNTKQKQSDYIIVWGTKDFLFDVISKINTEITNSKLNLVLISSFNINILKSYIQNFVSNKPWINEILLLDEGSKYEVLKQSENINLLEEEIIKNNYDYINLNQTSDINNFLFISKFINNLSNKGFSTTNIYLIIIIPFLLVGVSFFKHFIGLSTVGILIPTTLTLLFIKLGIIPTGIILITFLVVNLILGKLINKYKLHYTPKITLLTIINIIAFIIELNILDSKGMIQININDIMFVIFFILISEKLITVIISKEFGEYNDALISTLIFSILGYIFFSINIVSTFLLAYPELMIILIPISFIIGKFTGLRVTEYFRFKEVIKGIEE